MAIRAQLFGGTSIDRLSHRHRDASRALRTVHLQYFAKIMPQFWRFLLPRKEGERIRLNPDIPRPENSLVEKYNLRVFFDQAEMKNDKIMLPFTMNGTHYTVTYTDIDLSSPDLFERTIHEVHDFTGNYTYRLNRYKIDI